MKYTLTELWEMYRKFCNVTRFGNETSAPAFLAYIEFIEKNPEV